MAAGRPSPTCSFPCRPASVLRTAPRAQGSHWGWGGCREAQNHFRCFGPCLPRVNLSLEFSTAHLGISGLQPQNLELAPPFEGGVTIRRSSAGLRSAPGKVRAATPELRSASAAQASPYIGAACRHALQGGAQCVVLPLRGLDFSGHRDRLSHHKVPPEVIMVISPVSPSRGAELT